MSRCGLIQQQLEAKIKKIVAADGSYEQQTRSRTDSGNVGVLGGHSASTHGVYRDNVAQY